jgi:hypothetical protein
MLVASCTTPLPGPTAVTVRRASVGGGGGGGPRQSGRLTSLTPLPCVRRTTKLPSGFCTTSGVTGEGRSRTLARTLPTTPRAEVDDRPVGIADRVVEVVLDDRGVAGG